MLAAFQNEYDAMALEIFSLRKQLGQARQELSASLYQYDAAVRVAAAAIRERDDAQRALEQLTVSLGLLAAANEDVLDVNDTTAKATAKSTATIAPEINSPVPEDDIPALEINSPAVAIGDLIEMERQKLFALHKQKRPAGSFELHEISATPIKKFNHYCYRDQKLAINSGKTLTTYDTRGASGANGASDSASDNANGGTTTATTTISHAGGVVAVSFAEIDGTIQPIYATKKHIKYGDKTIKYPDIVDVKTHPTLAALVAVICRDRWALLHHGVEVGGATLVNATATAGEFHVDGALLAVATATSIDIYNVADANKAATLAVPAPVLQLAFGLNGYWLAANTTSTAHSTNGIHLYDLRKQMCIHTIEGTFTGFSLDASCKFLVTCSDDSVVAVHKYDRGTKKWENFERELAVRFGAMVVDGARCYGLGDKLYEYEVK